MCNKLSSEIVQLSTAAILNGCSEKAPSIPVLGAFFPSWMLCALLGIGLALVVRVVVGVALPGRQLAFSPLFYPMLALLLGTVAWIVFFGAAP